MTPAAALALHQRMINAHGESITIKRYSGTGAGRAVAAQASPKARVMGYQPAELAGAILQGDRKVIVLVDDLAAMLPLRTTDVVEIRGLATAIQAIDDSTRRVAGTLIALELRVRG